MRAWFIVNPIARKAVSKRRIEKFKRQMERGDLFLEVFEASEASEARKIAAEARDKSVDLVISGGGDGTIHEIINGIVGSQTALGIIPMGTGNVLAWELGIPLNIKKAFKVLLKGRRRKIDLCKCNGHYFSCMAGIGFDAQVIKELNPRLKDILGAMAYPLGALHTLTHYNLPEISVTFKDAEKEIKGFIVIVCNTKHYGGKYMICPDAAIDDGWLDVCVLQKKDIFTVIKAGLAVLMEQPPPRKNISFYKAKSLTVASSGEVPVQIDGDFIGMTPVTFDIIPRALTVIVPG
jgi:YegS/Rv2252/BmrU family lipid kinase